MKRECVRETLRWGEGERGNGRVGSRKRELEGRRGRGLLLLLRLSHLGVLV